MVVLYYYWGYIVMTGVALLIATKRSRWLLVWLILAIAIDNVLYDTYGQPPVKPVALGRVT